MASVPMLSARTGLVATLRAELAVARTAARTTLAGAHAAHWRAQTALHTARAGRAEAEAALAAERAARLAEAGEHLAVRRSHVTNRLGEVAAALAGAAAAPWPDWQPTPASRGALPGLFRVGTLAGHDLPALLPLLDLAHVAVCGGAAAAADGLVAGLLLRAIGSTAPGLLQIRVYDPERLGRGLAGFAALAGAGALRNVQPDGLGDVLDELVGHVHRVTETVLAGEYASVRDLAEQTGRRPEPWRVAVLLSPPGRPEEVAALSSVARTGLACGVHLITRDLVLPGSATVHLGQTATTSLTGTLPVALDPAPPRFADLLPEKGGHPL